MTQGGGCCCFLSGGAPKAETGVVRLTYRQGGFQSGKLEASSGGTSTDSVVQRTQK